VFWLWLLAIPAPPPGGVVSGRAAALTATQAMLMLAVFALVALALLVFQQRRLARRSAAAGTLQALVEEVAAARSAAEIGIALMRFKGRFPGIESLRLLVHEPQRGRLTPAGTEAEEGEPLAADHPAVKRCRELAEAQKSDRGADDAEALLPVNDPEKGLVYCLPVWGRGRLVGMLEIVPEPGAALPRATGRQGALHLARVIGTALASIEEAALREQVARNAGASEAARGVGRALEKALERLTGLRERFEEFSAALSGSPTAETAAALIEDLEAAIAELRAARDAGGGDDQPLEIDLQALVGSAVAQTRRELAGGVRIDAGALEPATVRAPLPRLEALLRALLRQAAEAAGGEIRVTARAAGSHAVIDISCPEGEAGLRRGWAELEPAAESLGGALRTVSGPEGRVTIELRLPAEPRSDSEPSRQAPAARLTVLLAEPDEAMRRRLLHALARRGHRVVPADLAEAADLAARFPFDCALCAPDGDPDRWEPLLERVVSLVGAVAVLAAPAAGSGSRWTGVRVLRRPPGEEELDEFLAGVEPPVGAGP